MPHARRQVACAPDAAPAGPIDPGLRGHERHRRALDCIKPADAFKDKTTAPNQLSQTISPYLKVIGWGWLYLSTVLDVNLPFLSHRR